MDKLIITVTCDSTMAYPSNPHNPTPKGYDEVAREYVRSVNAGASICHLHGPYTIDATIQADGTRLSDLDIPGWAKLRQDIFDQCSTRADHPVRHRQRPLPPAPAAHASNRSRT